MASVYNLLSDCGAFGLSLEVAQQVIDFNSTIPAEDPALLTPYGPNGPENRGEG